MDLLLEIKKFWKGDVDNSDATLAKYSRDASLFEVRPALVVFPKDADDIKNLVRFVAENKSANPALSVTVRSAGTCMAGGPLGESIILDVSRYLTPIHSIKRVAPYSITPLFKGSFPVSITGEAVVSPGCFYRDFEKATLAEGLLLPCYTASKTINSVGGMVGNNSAGELTLRYGKTEDYVKELKVVFADGNEYVVRALSRSELDAKIAQNDFEGSVYKNIWQLISQNEGDIMAAKPNVSKNSAGYFLWNVWDEKKQIFDLTKLIVGSQGTLGIVTEITLRLVDVKKHSALLVMFLYSLDGLGNVVNDALSVMPESVEAYDDKTMMLAIRFWRGFIKKRGLWGAIKLGFRFLPEIGLLIRGMPKLVLLVNCAGDDMNEIRGRLTRLQSIMAGYPNTKTRLVFSPAEAEKYWTIRRDSFALLREHFKGKQTAPFIDDVIVPPAMLPKFFPRIQKILDDNHLTYNIHGHASNGNFHIIPLLNLGDKVSGDVILKVADEVYKLVLEFHGSLTAEHNDGIIRTPYLSLMYGDKIVGLFAQTKDAFDAHNILNPGKKVGGSKSYIVSHLAGSHPKS